MSLPVLGQPPPPAADPSRIRVGVSACLLGEEVRYDGGHKRSSFLADTLGRFVDFVPVCPEVEIGLGTPRPPIRLERRGGEVRLVLPGTGEDLTARMRSYAGLRVAELAALELDGYVFKQGSPSCGTERIQVHGAGAIPGETGRGLFADELLRRLPRLPVVEEEGLGDPRLREGFLARVLRHHRGRAERAGWSRAALQRLAERHELLLRRLREGERATGEPAG